VRDTQPREKCEQKAQTRSSEMATPHVFRTDKLQAKLVLSPIFLTSYLSPSAPILVLLWILFSQVLIYSSIKSVSSVNTKPREWLADPKSLLWPVRIHVIQPLPTSNDVIPSHIPNLLYLTHANRFAWVQFKLRSPAHELVIALS